MGIYYLETGANQRASKVVYDREFSAIALAKPGDFDWEKIFDGATWFHITGITPAISESAAELALESVKAAQKLGVDAAGIADQTQNGDFFTLGHMNINLHPFQPLHKMFHLGGGGAMFQNCNHN
jgi:hypothetical protein